MLTAAAAAAARDVMLANKLCGSKLKRVFSSLPRPSKHYIQEWPEYSWRTQMDQNGPLQAKMDHFGLANAKIRFGIRSCWPKWSFGPFWTIWSSTPSDSTAVTSPPIHTLKNHGELVFGSLHKFHAREALWVQSPTQYVACNEFFF